MLPLYQFMGFASVAYINVIDVQIVLPYDDIEEVSNRESYFSCHLFIWSIFVNQHMELNPAEVKFSLNLNL